MAQPDWKRDANKRYREKTKHSERHARLRRSATLKAKYGITADDYDRMLLEQGGRCALCGTNNPGRRDGRFQVDHDHDTGVIRGLLCFPCNRALGRFGDNEDGLEKLVSYLAGSAI